MMHRLIVHVGMPKTGTTAIQNFLYDNNEKLKQLGYCYPDLIKDMNEEGYRINCRKEGRKKNGVPLSLFRRWDKWDDINEANKDAWETFEQILQKYLSNYNVIISDEDLWSQGNNLELLRRLKHISANLVIVVYLRRQDYAIESLWNQVVKRYGYLTKTFDEDKDRWINSRTLKYKENIEHLEEISGKENLRIGVFEKDKLDGGSGDVVMDFLSICGINRKNVEWSRSDRDNERISGSLLTVKLVMNKCLSKKDWLSGIIEEYFLDYISKREDSSNEDYFSVSERKEILDRFSDDNTYISRKYLSDDNCFTSEIRECKQWVRNINLEDVVAVFTHIALEQERKIVNLQYGIRESYLSKIKVLSYGKKLTLFGAGEKANHFLMIYDGVVDAIVDNDELKCGKKICKMRVENVEAIDDWSERFVVITSAGYLDISRQLEMYGLKFNKDFVLAAEIFGFE
jgi:hypothetical protein